MRINKFLASTTNFSRRKSEELVLNGRVMINGETAKNLSTNVLENDEVQLDGKILVLNKTYEYYMLNKPIGFISSAQDDRGREIVTDLIKTDARIYPVGRLDYNSQGLLLLTSDGNLTYKLTHPRNNISKTYIVKINGNANKEEIEKLRNGVEIDGVKLMPCDIVEQHKDKKTQTFLITIYEGRNREIRKMFETINLEVIFLKRIKIANLELDKNLDEGEYRELTKNEIDYLLSL